MTDLCSPRGATVWFPATLGRSAFSTGMFLRSSLAQGFKPFILFVYNRVLVGRQMLCGKAVFRISLSPFCGISQTTSSKQLLGISLEILAISEEETC